MVRLFAMVLAVLVLAGLGLGFYVYDQVTALELESITDDVHLIRGIGGNVAVLRGLRAFQRFVRQLLQVAERMRQTGASVEVTLAEELTEDVGYTPLVIPFVVQRDRAYVLRRAWEEATGAVRPD